MNLLGALLSRPRRYTGSGTNHEAERFNGVFELQPLVGQSAVLLHYTATRVDGLHLHREATLVALDADGTPCLWPVMEELPFVLPHSQLTCTAPGLDTLVFVFSSGPRDATESFREEITIELGPKDRLIYAHAWGMPGAPFAQRSRCELLPGG